MFVQAVAPMVSVVSICMAWSMSDFQSSMDGTQGLQPLKVKATAGRAFAQGEMRHGAIIGFKS